METKESAADMMAEEKSNRHCPVTGFTDREKELFLDSWKKLIKTTPKEFRVAALTMVLWMFDNVPYMRKRFENFAHCHKDELLGNAMFLNHSKSLMTALDGMTHVLYQPDKLKEDMRLLADSHLRLNPPVGTKYFKPFQAKIHLYIENMLQLDSSDETPHLWTVFIGALVKTFEEEEDKRGLTISHQHSSRSTSDKSCCCCLL